MKDLNLQRVKSILLISNSAAPNEEFLQNSISQIELSLRGVSSLCFIPHAAVTFSFDSYLQRVKDRLAHLNIHIDSLHLAHDPLSAIERAEAICVGGGNTFALVHRLQEMGVMDRIHTRIESGVPYIGWSAGSNIAAPSLATTNDMPIVEPKGFETLNLVPFQINPHYTDSKIEGHGGESRQRRIEEYIEMNRNRYVVGLREGTMLKIDNNTIKLIGPNTMRLFKYGEPTIEVTAEDNINFLIQK